MTQEERKAIWGRIAAGVAKNYDGYCGLTSPVLYLSVREHNLPIPRKIPAFACKEGSVVDKIAHNLPGDVGYGTGVVISAPVAGTKRYGQVTTIDVVDIEDTLLPRLCRIAEDPAYRIGETYFMSAIETVHDSMQLDSHQEIANIKGEYHGHKFEVSVLVRGDVRVIFRDHIYRCASRMPKELLDCYDRGADQDEIERVAKSDGGDYETPYYCDMNNWLEEVICVDGEEAATDVIDAPDDNSAEGWKAALLMDALEAVDDIEDIEDREAEDGDGEAGGFDLPDGSDDAAPHRVLVVWGEDLDGTPDTLANVLELMRDNLDAGGETNHYVERFGTAVEKEAFLKGLRYDSVSYDNFLVLTDEGDIGAVIAKYGDESTRKAAE